MPSSLRPCRRPLSTPPLIVAAVLGVIGVQASPAAEPNDPFADCRALAEQQADAYEPYRCIWRTGAGLGRVDEAESLLRSYEQERASAWPILVRGHLAFGDPERALELYGRALTRFEEQAQSDLPGSSALGRVLIHSNRRLLWNQLGDAVRAAAEVDAAASAAATSEDPETRTRAAVLRGQHLLQYVGALAPALRAFERAEAAVFPEGPVLLQRHVLDQLGLVQMQLGRWADARSTYRRWRDLAEVNADLQADLPTVEYNLINAHLNELEHLPDPDALRQLIDRTERALEQAVSLDNRRIQLFLHRSLAEMWAPFDRDRAYGHLDRCDDVSRGEAAADTYQCRWTRALLRVDDDPADALRIAEANLTETRTNGLPVHQMWAARAVIHVAFDALSPRDATERALELLAFLQDVQQTQSGISRAELVDVWLKEARLVMARLIEQGQLEAAFELNEQRRSQLLLSQLDRTGGSPEQVQLEIEGIERGLVEQQRALLRPDLEARERRSREIALAEAERRLDEVRERSDSARDRADEARSATLREVQQSLAPGQALLIFSVGLDRDLYGRPADGSWAFVVTADRLEVVPLADRSVLHRRVRVFRGMFQPGGRPIPAAVDALRELLIEPALASLAAAGEASISPPSTETLLIAPDDVLHALPFALLGGEDRWVAVVPSATVWQRLKERSQRPPSGLRVLVGDPRLPQNLAGLAVTESVALQRSSGSHDDPIFRRVAGLPGLPWARREVRNVRRLFGDAEQLVGDEATEAAFKKALAGRPADLVHLATHALIDVEEPQRSSIVLATGEVPLPNGRDFEDGLLQGREIAELDLRDSLVVASACQTADGRRLQGEGVLSLARSFFLAGARSVVATRWPLRDDHANALFQLFYTELARGAAVAPALETARRTARERGLPSEAWGALVLIGDPDLRLETGDGYAAEGRLPLWAMLVLGALLLAVSVAVARRRAG